MVDNPIKLHILEIQAASDNIEPLIYLYFSGDTYDKKDVLKSMGFGWVVCRSKRTRCGL